MRLRLAIAALAMTVAAGDVHAQSAPVDAQLFHPTATARGYFATDGAFVLRHLGGSGGLYASYALNPLVARCTGRRIDPLDGEVRGCGPTGAIPPGGRLVGHQLGMEAVASFAVVNHLEFGLALPFILYQATDRALAGLSTGTHVAGIGDLRLDIKILFHGWKVAPEQQLGVGIILGGSAPTGDNDAYMSSGWTGRMKLVVEWRARLGSFAVNFGANLRKLQQLADLYVGHQLTWGIAGRVVLVSTLELVAEANGLIAVGLPSAAGGLSITDAPIEVLGGLRHRFDFGLELSLAGGAGVTRGYGAPDARIVFGIRYASPDRKGVAAVVKEPDADGDGVADLDDRCPGLAGARNNGGCPEADRDRDGIPDRDDRCPEEVGVKAMAGCPEMDSDRDGIVDRLDKCPVEEGRPELEGCPAPDADSDGILDKDDRCPKEFGTRENQGCPDFDSDNDGYVDRLDQCPVEEETWNGVDDDDGCPDAGKPLAAIGDGRIELMKTVEFVGASATISPKSYPLLGVAAALINLHRELQLVRVEGHVADRGSALDNLELSRARAVAVRRYLQEARGVDPKRLTAQGYGRDRPLVPGTSAKAKKQNTRIELVLDKGNP